MRFEPYKYKCKICGCEDTTDNPDTDTCGECFVKSIGKMFGSNIPIVNKVKKIILNREASKNN